jgi:hypothetical protein
MKQSHFTDKKDYLKLTDWQKQHIKYTYNAILKGNIIAHIVSVNKTGMSRKIKFYYIRKNRIERATDAINFLLNEVIDYSVIDKGLKVNGCGMDMIFHTLYNCLEYDKARKWSQNYNVL